MKINLGCGPHALPGWMNVDIEAHPGVNFALDLSKGKLPFQDASADFVFSEHFLEHISLPQGQTLMREIFRVLKPGGTARISTPDLHTLVDDYSDGTITRWEAVWTPKTPCQMVNEGMREWGHQFLYDFHEIASSLSSAGFKRVRAVEWHSSQWPELRDLEVRPDHGDLIVEAYKSDG